MGLAGLPVPEDLCCPAVAEGLGERVTELLIFVLQVAYAVGGCLKAAQQGGAEARWRCGGSVGVVAGLPAAGLLDLGAYVVLGENQDLETRASRATDSKVIRTPVASMRRSAVMARLRVCWPGGGRPR